MAARELQEMEILEQKLNVHLDYWAADKWLLESSFLMADKAWRDNAAFQTYETAKLRLSIAHEQEELFIANLKLENAFEDVRIMQSRLNVAVAQIKHEKDEVNAMKNREVRLIEKETEMEAIISETKTNIRDLEKKMTDMQTVHRAELLKAKDEKEQLNCERIKEIAALVRERDFVWNQLKRMEADYGSQLKIKETNCRDAVSEMEKLRTTAREQQRLAEEKSVELTVLKVEMKNLEEQREKMKSAAAKMAVQIPPQLLPVQTTGDMGDNRDQDSTNVVNERDELRKALKRLDEVRLENDNLRVLYAELEAKLNDKQKEVRVTNRQTRKDSATRNLKAELEAAAVAVNPQPKLQRTKKKKATTKSQDTRSGSKRKAGRDEHSNNCSSKRRMATSTTVDDGDDDDDGEPPRVTNFFSSGFSIPKVKITKMTKD